MTPQQHARIEALAGLIDFLDLMEGDCDLEPEEDRCTAGDDEPRAVQKADDWPGDPDDGEPEEDRCEAGDDNLSVRLRAMGFPGDFALFSEDCENSHDDQADTEH